MASLTVLSSLFRAIINLLIIGNAICLAVSYNDLEWFFLSAFILEALLKMYAIGFQEYFHHRWNIFDFTIVFVSTTYSLLSLILQNCNVAAVRFDRQWNWTIACSSSHSRSGCARCYSSRSNSPSGQTRGQYRTLQSYLRHVLQSDTDVDDVPASDVCTYTCHFAVERHVCIPLDDLLYIRDDR